ncbi:hypothetical protein INT43_002172 [Umbelopsis isabellina]|uniref:Tyrosine aminotransferase n=1 Tax=Mortierella isabellina TaxID=91625 RepID=A0A8H7UL39_MORIS|nr:hypothetical protein INT43_002172 [Umbelopsis isabellina]
MSTRPSTWNVPASRVAKNAHNPIRQIVDKLKVDPNAEKDLISLALGDPTVFGNFNVDDSCNEAVIRNLQTFKANGYPPAHVLIMLKSPGTEQARAAVAEKFNHPDSPLTARDVILANGCSGALDLAINVLCTEGQNMLIPRPGFSLYENLAVSRFIEAKFYNLVVGDSYFNPERSWEADLEHMESLIDDKTACILVNNPSNPCGSVYSEQHLRDILALAEKHHLPIIADEIYCDLVFKGNHFYPMATLTKEVPILSVGGLAKKYLVPGWRVGWVTVHDRNGILKEVHEGILNLSQLILGPCSIIQAALPDILHNTPQEFHDKTIEQLEVCEMAYSLNTKISEEGISQIPGLTAVVPQGAMYMMVGVNIADFKDIKDDVEFTQKLVAEENVLCLPGQCFGYPNFFRIVITPPADRLKEAYERMKQFCARHHV